MSLLALATAIALVVEDIGLVVGLTGSLVGASNVYIAPAVISLRARAYAKAHLGGDAGKARVHAMLGGGRDVAICHLLVPLGVVIGGIGALETIKAYFF